MVGRYEQLFPAKTIADVEVITHSGRRWRVEGQQAQWEPPDTLPTDAELEQKFRWLVEPVLGEARTGELVELIWEFEGVEEARKLIEVCRG